MKLQQGSIKIYLSSKNDAKRQVVCPRVYRDLCAIFSYIFVELKTV